MNRSKKQASTIRSRDCRFYESNVQYEPLRLFRSRIIFKYTALHSPLEWKMNLCAYCSETDMFYLAIQDTILAWHPPAFNIFYSVEKFSDRQKDNARDFINMNKPEYTWIIDQNVPASTEEKSEINHIRLCHIGITPVLVAVTSHGSVRVWSTKLPFQPPLHIQNHHASSWGIAWASRRRILAISANNHAITLYIVGFHSVFHEYISRECECTGHENNIPTLDFHSSEEYLISGSIDGSIRIWSIVSKNGDYGPVEAHVIYKASFTRMPIWYVLIYLYAHCCLIRSLY